MHICLSSTTYIVSIFCFPNKNIPGARMALPMAGNRRKGKQKKAPPHVFVLKQLRRDGGNFGKLASLFFFREKFEGASRWKSPALFLRLFHPPPEALDPSQHKSRSLRVVAPPGGLEKIERCQDVFSSSRSDRYTIAKAKGQGVANPYFPRCTYGGGRPRFFFSPLADSHNNNVKKSRRPRMRIWDIGTPPASFPLFSILPLRCALHHSFPIRRMFFPLFVLFYRSFPLPLLWHSACIFYTYIYSLLRPVVSWPRGNRCPPPSLLLLLLACCSRLHRRRNLTFAAAAGDGGEGKVVSP